MFRFTILCCLGSLPLLLGAQLSIDFSSNDLSDWQGDVNKFEVNAAQQLQLNDLSRMSPAHLFRPFSIQGETVWEAYIEYDFSPSASNFADVMLQTNAADIDNFNGYFLRIGGSTGSDDALTLYRQDGDERIELLTATMGAVGGSQVQVRVNVTRDEEDIWTVAADYSGGRNFQEEGSVFDATHTTGQFFGVNCRYTNTRSDKIFFDDFIVNTTQDNTPPQLTAVTVLDATTIQLLFNEELNEATAVGMDNYRIIPIVDIEEIQLMENQLVTLSLVSPLTPDLLYTLEVDNISDPSGNAIVRTTTTFTFVPPVEIKFGDIVITEIMVDPTPAIGLPEIEYIELYNRSAVTLNLADMQLEDERERITLPEFLLPPNDYAIVYEGEEDDFELVSNRLALPNALSLGNSADRVSLFNKNGQLVHEVMYEDSWYRNSSKDDGGWSLEWSHPNLVCDPSSEFWEASTAVVGGTPGLPNSKQVTIEDDRFTGIERVEIIDNQTIRLLFEERIALSSITVDAFTINGNEILEAQLEASLISVLLRLQAPLNKGVHYTIAVNVAALSDCLGNTLIQENTLSFSIPEAASPFDLVINEILFDPKSGGSDFIELYNRSTKTIDLSTLFLADQSLMNVRRVETDFLLAPNEYVVLTESAESVLQQYSSAQASRIIETALPSLPNDEGSIVIYRLEQNNEVIEIDALLYEDDWHNALLDNVDGVSLERIQPDSPTQNANNWQSAAAAAVGFGTPTVQNSQFFESTIVLTNNFQLANDQISPDGDGFQDVLLLEYELEQAGFLANVRLFDATGRQIADLARSELLAAKGTYVWDGALPNREVISPGIYILQIDYFEPNGASQQEQLTFSVARQF